MNTDMHINHVLKNEPFRPPMPPAEEEILSLWKERGKPLVSIVCATYQHKNFIRDALNSFLMQKTSFPFEIIVRDDASTDGTKEIVEEYAELYSNIIKPIFERENQYSKGVRPLRITMAAAKGEFIAFCEGDDYWCDDAKLEKQIGIMRSQSECVVTYHDAIHLSTATDAKPKFRLHDDGRKGFTSEQLLQYSYMPTLTLCFKNVIGNMPDEHSKVKNGDTFLISLLGQYGSAVYVPDIKPAMYREHDGGIWSGLADKDKRISSITTCYWLSMYYKRMSNKNMSDYYALSAMNHMLSEIKVNKLSFLKWFVIKYFHRVHAVYFAFKTKIRKFFVMLLGRA